MNHTLGCKAMTRVTLERALRSEMDSLTWTMAGVHLDDGTSQQVVTIWRPPSATDSGPVLLTTDVVAMEYCPTCRGIGSPDMVEDS